MQPLFERTHILLGDDGLTRLQKAHVFVCGLGGVGGFAAEALARAGVGRLTLLDHDVVSPSNMNRQLLATGSTVGRKKVDVMGGRVADINPACHLELHDQFLSGDNMAQVLDAVQPDVLADAIDSLNCKVNLLLEAQHRHLPTVSSMGAGGRLDATAIAVDDLMDTEICPLAREVRKRLRRRGGGRGIQAVWSREPARPPLPPEPTSQGRERAVNGTISYLPALFGLTMAGVIIENLLQSQGGRPHDTA